jgi:hypothetical protein
VARVDFDEAGAAYTATSRSRAARFQGGVWKPFFESEEPTDCYIHSLQASPDGQAALVEFSCPPTSEGSEVTRSLYSLSHEVAKHELACPAHDAPRRW